MQHAQNQSSNEKTPETISKAVASLPPEQMFELLKQMKQCVQVSCIYCGQMINTVEF
jgi:cleavage stimulation factor subunit 2